MPPNENGPPPSQPQAVSKSVDADHIGDVTLNPPVTPQRAVEAFRAVADSQPVRAGGFRLEATGAPDKPLMSGKGVACSAGPASDHLPTLIGRCAPLTGIKMGVDWISATSKKHTHTDLIEMAQCYSPGEQIECGGQNGYRNQVRSDAGWDVHWDNINSPESVMVNYRGKVLNRLVGWERLFLLGELVDQDLNLTRLDICADLHGPDQTLVDDLAALRQEDAYAVSTSQIDASDNDGKSTGKTVYLGSRSSQRFIRVYDKSAEQGLGSRFWTRAEAVFKRDYATSAAAALIKCERSGTRDDSWTDLARALVFDPYPFKPSCTPEAWTALRGSTPTPTTEADRRRRDLDALRGHIRRTVLPRVLLLAEVTGQTWAEVIAEVASPGTCKPARKSGHHGLIDDYLTST